MNQAADSVARETSPLEGPNLYDDAAVFRTYMERRARTDAPNETLELPAVEELLGSPLGQDFLDLGCGDGRFGLRLLRARAASYTGIDGSENMIRTAQTNLAGTAGTAQRGRLESLCLPREKFTRVTARLVLHYLEDLAPALREVAATLKDDGLFVFSVEHPVITSCASSMEDAAPRQDWIVDDYFKTGPRVTKWMGAPVVKHHRTVEDYCRAVQAAGLQFEALREARPLRAHIADDALFNRRCRIPLFLVVAARKPRRTAANG